MYAKLSRDQVFSSASSVNAAVCPNDATGKEFTKEVLKRTVRVAKGDLRHDLTHQELRRLVTCAAYNALIAVVVNVMDDIKFYNNFLFGENASKGEALWASMIDCNTVYDFDVEVSFKPGNKSRFVAVRKTAAASLAIDDTDGSDSNGNDAATVQMFATNYLSDSSLGTDLSQYDYSAAVVLAVGEQRTHPVAR